MRNDLFGRPLGARTLGPYTLSLSRYERGSRIAPHVHDAAFATVVLDGGYRECGAGFSPRFVAPHSIVVHAPGERHADAFAPMVVEALMLELFVAALAAPRAFRGSCAAAFESGS